MKQIIPLFLFLFISGYIVAQSNECSSAVTLTVTANCTSPVFGSTSGFSSSTSIPACVGTPDDDGWYKFVATASSHYITVTGSATYDAVVQAFSGTCGALTSLQCVDNSLIGGSESLNLTGLTVGNTYFIRIYDYYAGSGSGSFSICLTGPPTAPVNNTCVNAISLSVNSDCLFTEGTTLGATQSITGCSGNANDDVWYKFVANNYTQDITLNCSSNFDGVVQLLLNNCTTFTSVICQDKLSFGGTEIINAVGLTIGSTYLIRVYEYGAGAGGTFSICVSGNATTPAQPNDEPCDAILVPEVTSACNYVTFSNVGATTTTTAPTPFSCTGGSGGAGGFGSGTKDVWFKVIVPANGIISITPKPNQGAGWLTDESMAIYSGSCGSLTQIACSRDYTSFPGTGDDLLPFYVTNTATPLPAGSTIYIRFWPDGTTSTGNFAFCIQSPTNDNCENALYVCNLNGFSGSTSEAYKADRPGSGSGQMFGNNEDAAGNDLTNGTNSGGPFGLYPGAPTGTTPGTYSSPYLDVNIENNSWIKFTASATTSNLKVVVGDCFVGGYPAGGLQMQVFSATNCNNFFPVSNFEENSTGFTITAFGLTIGNDYYLMVDGYAKDICNYTIQALDGVAFPAIVASPTIVCAGSSSTLTAPSASSYLWSPGGATTQTIVVTPDKPSSTYTCVVGGICGQQQTLTKTIVMNPLPVISINSGTTIVNCGTQTTTLTASGANTYSWSTGNITSSFTTSPSTTTTYSVVGTNSVTGCKNTAAITVSVNPKPNVTAAASSNSICTGSSTTLNGSGADTYTWTNSVINGSAISPTTTTNYTVTGTNTLTGCTNTAAITVTVNSIPTTTVSTTGTITCVTPTINLNSTPVSGASYTWTAPGGSSIFGGTANNQNAIGEGAGTYTLNVMSSAGCPFSVTVAANINTTTPTSSATGGTLTCSQTSTILVGGPASGVSYNWSGPGILGSNTTANVTATVAGTYSLITTSNLTGCSSTITIATVTNNLTTPTVSAGTNQNITCAAPTVTLSGSATPGSLFSWVNNGATTNTTTTSGSGFYTLTATDPNTGCSASSTVEVTASPGSPTGTVSSISNSITCTNTNVAVSITSTSTPVYYSWSGPGIIGSTTTSSTTVSQGGTYTVTITFTTTGCSSSFPVFVPTDTTPVVAGASLTPLTSSITCQTTSVTLSAIPTGTNYSYSWLGPSILSGSTTANPIVGSGGNYTVTITNTTNGCSGVLGTTNVAVPSNTAAPTLSLSATTLTTTCGSAVISISASSDSDPNSTYTWTPPSTGTIDNTSISSPNISGSGIFTVSVSNTINGCLSSPQTVTVTSDVAIPDFNIANDSVKITCSNPSPSVSITSTVSSVTYSWSPDPNSGLTNANATFTATGNYTCLIINTVNGCSTDAAQVNVGIDTLAPSLSLSPTSAVITCSVTSTTITAVSSSITDTPVWSTPAGTFTSTSVTGSVPGDYIATLVNSINGCSISQTLNIASDISPPDVNTGSTALVPCGSSSVNLIGTSTTTDPISFTWAGPTNGTIISGINNSNAEVTGSGVYTLTVMNLITGCSATSTVNVIDENVIANFTADPMIGEIPLTVTFTNTSIGATSYSWNFGNGLTSSFTDPNTIFTNAGTFTVTLIAYAGGCSDTITKTILAEDGFTIEIPNVFTPNGDGANDAFHIKVTGVKSAEGYIYNRWGQLLYSWDALNTSWDGKASNGEGCPDATYYYLIKVIDKKNKEHIAPGYVLIIR